MQLSSDGDSSSLRREDRLHLFEAGGRGLARLHEMRHEDDDPITLVDAWTQRTEALRARLSAVADGELIERAQAWLTRPVNLSDVARVACHGDYAPRNWRYLGEDPRGIAILDFEHARPNAAMHDLARVLTETRDLRLVRAFLTGYGGLLEEQWRLLDSIITVHGLSTLAWGLRHGDHGFVRHGRTILATLAKHDGHWPRP